MAWRWDHADPFGALPPNENPAGVAAFSYNPRFPGQLFDKESGLHQNYFRDYDPKTARYVTSDPIGLQGGTNTYAYVLGNPLWYSDALGLSPGDVFSSPDNAAKDAGIYSRANCRNLYECGGWIFKKGKGFTYNYLQGSVRPDAMTHAELQSCKPPRPVASWHKHPSVKGLIEDDKLPGSQFSGEQGGKNGDIPWVEYNKLPLYLIAPSGLNKVYEPEFGERILD
jgi:RHS repeat-associated protein